jgi:hypothetical protein
MLEPSAIGICVDYKEDINPWDFNRLHMMFFCPQDKYWSNPLQGMSDIGWEGD